MRTLTFTKGGLKFAIFGKFCRRPFWILGFVWSFFDGLRGSRSMPPVPTRQVRRFLGRKLGIPKCDEISVTVKLFLRLIRNFSGNSRAFGF